MAEHSPYEQLQSLLLSTSDVETFLQQLAVLAVQVIGDQDLSCGVTLRYDANVITVAGSDDRATRLDETQYALRNGPCLEAMRTGQPVLCSDLGVEGRWPEYVGHARSEGLRCSLSLPLTAAGASFGALNVYAFSGPHLFGEVEQRQYQLFAEQASGALQLATRQVKDAALLSQLEQALNSRSVIDQAVGILIAGQHCTAEEAFDLLRRRSQTSHRKMRDIAADLIVETTGRPPTPGRPFDAS